MMYRYVISVAGTEVIIHADVPDCLNIFIIKKYVENGVFSEFRDGSLKCVSIYLFERMSVVDKVKVEKNKLKTSKYTVYISNKPDNPRGVIIEKIGDDTGNYIVVAANKNSQVISLRSILIKLFFKYATQLGCYPLHCSAISYKNKGYLFLAESKGGKSTIYFTFSSYGTSLKYKLITDDTLLCKCENEAIIGYSMPLKPSLRQGTLDYLDEMEHFCKKFDEMSYNIEDQIYIDVSELRNSETALSCDISTVFFARFSDTFSIVPITDMNEVKKKLAIIICGYKATPVNENLVTFLNSFVKKVKFFLICVPENLNDFFEEFEKWEEENGGEIHEKSNTQ